MMKKRIATQLGSRSIYKYCSLKNSKLILENNEVVLNSPSSFNDPYDSSLMFNQDDLRIARDIVFSYFADVAMKSVIKEHFHELPFIQKIITYPATLTIRLNEYYNYKFNEYRPSINFARLIKAFSKLGFKNGKEASASQIALENYLQLQESHKIESGLKQAVEKVSANLLITCFSKRNDSALMWGHYADNNRGVCIEFEDEKFLDVLYSNERASIKIKNLMSKILWSYHTQEKLTLSKRKEGMLLVALAPLLTKSNDWSYEEEVRCIINSSNPKVISRDELRLYKMNHIKSITMGCRTTDEQKQDLLILAKNKNIAVYQMELSTDTYQLIRKKVD